MGRRARIQNARGRGSSPNAGTRRGGLAYRRTGPRTRGVPDSRNLDQRQGLQRWRRRDDYDWRDPRPTPTKIWSVAASAGPSAIRESVRERTAWTTCSPQHGPWLTFLAVFAATVAVNL